MPRAIDGSFVPGTTVSPCGAIAIFDPDSGIGYRCTKCFAIIGSVSMPDRCRELMQQEKKQ